jgi:hypothetical protein
MQTDVGKYDLNWGNERSSYSLICFTWHVDFTLRNFIVKWLPSSSASPGFKYASSFNTNPFVRQSKLRQFLP